MKTNRTSVSTPGGDRGSAARVIFTLVLAVLFALPSPAEESYFGKPVTSIEFRTDTDYDVSKLSDIVPIMTGMPLSIDAVQKSIKRLFDTADFRDIRVDAKASDGGVALTFILSINYRIGTIDFEGLTENRDSAENELVIERDSVLSLSAVDRSAEAVQRMLARRGYIEATVDPEVRFNRKENRADVTFHVESGPRSTIGAIAFEGASGPFEHEELVERMKLRRGEPYRRSDARRAADRLVDFLVGRDYRKAEVRFLDEHYNSETQQTDLHFNIKVGPLVRVTTEPDLGRRVRRLLPFDRDEGYSSDSLERGRERVIEFFQKRGRFFVSVEIEESSTENELVILYRIDPGDEYQLGEIVFDGAHTVEADRLKEVISTGQTGALTRTIGSLVGRRFGTTNKMLSNDRDALDSWYRLNGFTESRVSRPTTRRRDDGTFDVVFPIFEGPQTIVSQVSVDGVEAVAESRLPQTHLQPGQPLNPQSVVEDIVNLKTLYARDGFVDIAVDPSVEYTDEKTRAQVTYRVVEGSRFRLGELTVRGNTYTRDSVILKKTRLRSGEPFNYFRLLDSQQNLYRLGILQRVDLQPRPSLTNDLERDVTIRVEEGKALTVAGSLGYSTEDGFRGTASISHRNLFGTARYLGLEGTVSQRVNRFVFTYREPFLWQLDIPTQLTVFRRDELRANSQARIKAVGTFVEATRSVGRDLRWSLRYEYKRSECVVEKEGDLCDLATGDLPIEGIPREDQEIRISSISPSVFLDQRNDPINPSDGFYVGASIEYAFPILSAETNFLKGFVQGSWYQPLSARTEIVASGRIGLIEPLANSGADATVPFAERFTAGGETTHRGFDLDELGVPCQTLIPDPASIPEELPSDTPCQELFGVDGIRFIAVGGNALVIANLELRFPVYGDSLRGALFVDSGNVWSAIGDVDPGEFRYGVGFGFRYLTPVGPLRFDFGRKIDPEKFESPWVTFITLGYAF